MTDRQRRAAFLKEQTAQLNQWSAARRAGAGDVVRILKKAEARVRAALADAPTEWQAHHLPKLQKAVKAAMAEAERELKGAAAAHQGAAFDYGRAALDAPLAAAGLDMGGLLSPTINTRQLSGMRNFLTKKMQGVSRSAVTRINDQLGLVIAGGQTPSQAMDAVALLLDGNRGRALTVVRTEVGRAYATATHERMEEAKPYLPKLKKQWRKSGKRHGRIEHILADGQVRDVDEPFDVGGEKIMYPRAPGVSAKNSINCGCESLPYMDGWDVSYPDKHEQKQKRAA